MCFLIEKEGNNYPIPKNPLVGHVVLWGMRYTSLIPLSVLILASGCLIAGVDDADEFIEPNQLWMSIAPIQCMGNPWEVDWLASHDNDYESYPGDSSTPELEEADVIGDYYMRQGVQIERFDTEQWDGAVCLACSCPAGYTLLALVDDTDRQPMLELGFSAVDSPD